MPFPFNPARPAILLLLGMTAAGCVPGNGPGTDHPNVPGGMAGYLDRGPLPADQTTPTTVGPAGTGPAGSASSVGDGMAVLGR